MNELVHFNKARQELALATKIDEVKIIRDKAEALRAYAKQAGESLDMQNNCAEIKIRAERRGGELLGERELHPPGPEKKDRSQDVTYPPKLSDIGISKIQSSRWQQIASIPGGIFEDHISTIRAAGNELTSAGVQRLAKTLEPKDPDELDWLKLYNVWNFGQRDARFGIKYPGNIPAGLILNVLYYYTKENDLVVDPMAGGGITIDCCKFLNRDCIAYDINPVRKDIEFNDILNGYPDQIKDCKLIFLDPPYWQQKKGSYSNHKTNLVNMSLDNFYKSMSTIARNSKSKLIPEGYIALLMGSTDTFYGGIDHAFECYKRFNEYFKLVRRVIVPYQTQQYQAWQVQRAKQQKKMLNLFRDLMIFKNE